jgi:isopentenyldiphosphate isomerase
MEYLDILDDNGKPTGQSASREEVHEKGLWHRSAQVVIMNSDGRIFVHRRASTKKYYPGLYDVYFGGHVLSGETSIEALIREVKEEIGIDLIPGDFELLFDIRKADIQNGGSFINNDFAEVYLARKDFTPDRLSLQEEEIGEVRFFTEGEIREEIRRTESSFIPREREYDLLFSALDTKGKI